METPTPQISKRQAVKAAIQAGHCKPKEGVSYIFQTFGLKMATSEFSASKNSLKNNLVTSKTTLSMSEGIALLERIINQFGMKTVNAMLKLINEKPSTEEAVTPEKNGTPTPPNSDNKIEF